MEKYRLPPITDGSSRMYLEPECEACYIITKIGRIDEMIWIPQWTYEVIVPNTDENKNKGDTDKKKEKKKKILLLGRVAILTPGI